MVKFIYSTFSSIEEAKLVARTLVEEQLVACANILPQVTSIYRWQDNIEEENEVILFAKTRELLCEQVIERIKAMHSYECPCVVALPIEKGNDAFLEWIETSCISIN